MTIQSDYRACDRCGIIRITKDDAAACKDCAKVPAPRETPRKVEQLAGYSIRRATELACLVRDEGRDGIGAYLDRLDTQALYGLCVALAAMVPVDQTAEDLLAWLHAIEDSRVVAA